MAHIIELPYEGDDISMFILLPPFSKEDGIEQVLKRLTLENFKSVVNGSLLPRQVQVSLPKFTLEQTIELTPVSIGFGSVFCMMVDFNPCCKRPSRPIPNTIVNIFFLPSGDGVSFPPLDT